MSRLTDLLSRYASQEHCISAALVFDLARQSHYTGPVVFHFRDGKPLKAEPGFPIQVALDPDGSVPAKGKDLTNSGS